MPSNEMIYITVTLYQRGLSFIQINGIVLFYLVIGLIIGVRAMSMDNRVYDSPEEFLPERWLQKNTPTLSSEFAFGFGRRYISIHFLEKGVTNNI